MRKLKNWLEAYLKYTENSEPSILYRKWVGISVLASVLQRKCWLQWDVPTYPNLYIVLVGPSGARKGTAMNPGKKLLDELGIEIASDSVIREQLIRELNESASVAVTPEGDQIFHSSLTVFSPELTVFLGYDKKQLVMDLTDWYDCPDRWRYSTKNSGKDDIRNVFVNLIGATTPKLLQSTMTSDAIGGGLTARIIFIFSSRKEKSIAFPWLSDKQEELKGDLIHDLSKIYSMTGRFKVTEKFALKYSKWYEVSDKVPYIQGDKLDGYLQRRPKHLLKLSMIFSASRNSEMVITEEDFSDAERTLSEAEQVMSKVFAGIGESSVAGVTERIMSRVALEKKISVSDIVRSFYEDADYETINKIISTLKIMGFAETKIINGVNYVIYKDAG